MSGPYCCRQLMNFLQIELQEFITGQTWKMCIERIVIYGFSIAYHNYIFNYRLTTVSIRVFRDSQLIAEHYCR